MTPISSIGSPSGLPPLTQIGAGMPSTAEVGTSVPSQGFGKMLEGLVSSVDAKQAQADVDPGAVRAFLNEKLAER